MPERATRNRDQGKRAIIAIFLGHGPAEDSRGNASGAKCCAANAIAEYVDFGRRYGDRINHAQRSFEDTQLEQNGLELSSRPGRTAY